MGMALCGWVAGFASAKNWDLEPWQGKYHLLFEQAPDGVCISKPNGELLVCNRAAAALLGIDANRFHEFRAGDFYLNPDHRRTLQELLRRNGSARRLLLQFKRADGVIVTLEVNATVSRERGEVVYQTFLRDVTERLHFEEELQRSTESLEALVKAAPVAIVSVDREDCVRRWNPAAEAMFGWREEEVLGKPIPSILPEEQEAHRRRHGQILGGVSVRNLEISRLRTDGTRIPVSLSAAPVQDMTGQVSGVMVVLIDLTERKRAEAELLRTERHCRELVENASEIIFFLDLNGNITGINPAAVRATGYTLEEITGMNVTELLAPQLRASFMQRFTSLPSSPIGFEVEVLTKLGNVLLLDVNASILYENGIAVGIQNIARDITERRRLETQLRMAQKMDAVGRLAGGVAHDFNNLLHVIHSSVELAQLKPQDIERYLDSISAAADRAAELTQQLLAFSRTQVLVPRPLDLNSVVQGASKMLARLIGEDIELSLHLGENLNTVHADPSQLEQVLLNLAVNARDAMPRGGKLMLETRNVHLSTQQFGFVQPGDYVELLVTDTGVGMSPEVQARVFEPFFTTKEHGKGTGLGLATVYGIVKQSDGYITLNSEPGVGTAARVLLPAFHDAALPAAPKRSKPKMVRGTENVLVVEDEDGVRRAVREILQNAGYTVVEAPNPAAAFIAAAEFGKPVHLLITDVVMPGCTGGVFADQFRERHPETRVLYISGYTDDAIVRHGLLRAEVKLLKKPFTISTLTVAVREVLDAPSADAAATGQPPG